VGACLLAFSGASNAQFGASLGVESDARFRGISLSGGRPDLRLSLSYDHASGVYAGVSATRAEFLRDRPTLQWLVDAGRAFRLSPELGGEFGFTRTASVSLESRRYDYTELFAGLSGERWSARAYYAPNYFGFDQATVYIELDAHAPLTTRLRLFGHLGALSAVSGSDAGDHPRTRGDLRVGLGIGLMPSTDVQLAWVGATRGGPYVVEYSRRRSTWLLSALVSF